MAIQHRRGEFINFDPSRLLPGEWAIVLSGDTSTGDGQAVYICFSPGRVKRVAFQEDAAQFVANAIEEIVDQMTEDIAGYTEAAKDATDSANQAVKDANQAKDDLLAAAEAGDFDGATFIPTVNDEGDISWDNDKGRPNPETKNIKGPIGPEGPRGPEGERGPQGEIGEGLKMLGTYPDADSLLSAHPDGNEIGDAYGVEGNYYVWNGTEWKDAGALQGAKGEQGPMGPQGVPGDPGKIAHATATIDDKIGNPTVNVSITGEPGDQTLTLEFSGLRGDQGPQGPAGDGANFFGNPDEVLLADGSSKKITELGKVASAAVADTISSILAINKGGTGKSTRREAYSALMYGGTNPISSTDEDTHAKWKSLGPGVVYLSESVLNGQPSQTGFVFTVSYASSDDITQLWLSSADGKVFHRYAGAETEAMPEWTEVYTAESEIKVTTAESAEKLGTKTVGSTSIPVYIKDGVPTEVLKVTAAETADMATTAGSAATADLATSATNADNANVAAKLGKDTVGSATNGIYLSNGVPTPTTSSGSSSLTEAQKKEIALLAHPVGSYYWSSDSTSPQTLFGGTWKQITDCFVWAKGSSDVVGDTIRGQKTVVLTEDQMPQHYHSGPSHSHGLNGHTHTIPHHRHDLNRHYHGMKHNHTAPTHAHGGNYIRVNSGNIGSPMTTGLAPGSLWKGAQLGLAETDYEPITINDSTKTTTDQVATGTYTDYDTSASTVTTSGCSTNTKLDGTQKTSNAGSGSAHENMPPYIVAYCWRRTA